MNRITTIDVMRGLVMVIMALDHVRDLLHSTALTQSPTDLATTTTPLFLTRWITHLCAPTFVFLSGTSAYLVLSKKQHADSARRFLRKRGVVLILLELTVINFAFWFDIQFRSMLLQVIYAIGGGFIILSLLSKLSVKQVGIIGLIIIAGHNLLQLVPPIENPTGKFISSLFFQVNFFQLTPGFAVLVAYPLIPWLGIMLVGYAFGATMEQPMNVRKPLLLRYALVSLTLFVVIRFINLYGDPAPWAVQKSPLFTFLSFINVTKYPPSLQYDLLMLGIALLILWLADGADNVLTRALTVYGKVPMFYYILHWYAVHLLMIAMTLIQGYGFADIQAGTLNFGRPAGAGVDLEVVCLVWLGLVVVLYPLCRWYGRYKPAHPEIGILRYI
ncbi:DUF1624 domain-containing protein [Spirosoma terrae]|uniref:DUF1624 domain-containing protein n=1 Tax=Spirosoma terrae TaxID=1968276 RepID=A0A6L9LCT8_9BACT|nr:heparan-alpha-glucosaminide N-acetyltransferase domain-containing protein [Spirosoma terrae]NDU98346.1 DUF1624 domain-containing protein [Spirosoma terrae]